MSSEAAEFVAQALEQDAEAHEAGRFNDIAKRWDDVYGKLLPIQDTSEPIFAMAMRFWDDWKDASNHKWMYHKPMKQTDWPRVARVIAACLRSGTLPEEKIILDLFMPKPKKGLIDRIKSWYGKFS